MGAAESRVRPSVWLVEACASLEPVEVDEVVTLCRRAANAKGQPETSSSCPSNSTECALYVLEHERTLGLQTHHDCSNITDALRDAFATPPMVHAVLHRLGDTISTRGDGFVTGNDSSKNPPVGVLGKLLAAIASCKRAAYGNKDDALVLIQAVLDTCASQVTSLEVTDKTKFFERLIEELAFSATRDTALLDDDATNKFLAYLALDGAKTYFASGGSGNSTSTVSSSKKNHRNQFRDTVSRSMYDASLPSRRGKLLPKLVGADGETSLMTESPLLAPTAAWFLGLSCPSEWRVKWRRVFDSTKHGASFVSFLDNTKNVGPTLVLIQTKIGYVLGGLTSLSLKSGSDFFGDEKSFVFSLGKLFGAEESSADDASSFDFGVHRPTGVNSHFCYCAQGFTSERFPNGVGFGGQIGHFSLFLSSDFERGHARHTAATFGGVRLIRDAHASSAEKTGALLSSDDGTINQDGSFEVEKVVAYAVDGDFAKRFLEKNVLENRRGAHGGGGVLSQKYAETRMLLDVARRDAGGAERQDRHVEAGDGYDSDASSASSSSSHENASSALPVSHAARALFVAVVAQNALGSLTLPEKEAIAGAAACVCLGLDGDLPAASEVLRVIALDLLGLDETALKAVEPLLRGNDPPRSVSDLETGIRRARDDFIKTTQQAVTETQTLNPNPDEENDDTHQPSRWSVLVAALVVAAAAAGRHDARCAAALRRLAKAAHVPWETIAELEDLIAWKLRQAMDVETESSPPSGKRAKESDASAVEKNAPARLLRAPTEQKQKFSFTAMREQLREMSYGRAAVVGAAAIAGGGLMFVTGGVAAPAVLASLASLGAAGGVTGALAVSAGSLTSFFGGATGISYILGGVGAGLTGWRTARRLEGLSQFAFLPLKKTRVGLRVFLFVPGFLRDPTDLFRSFGATDGIYSAVVDLERTVGSGKSSETMAHTDTDTKKQVCGTDASDETSDEPKSRLWRSISSTVGLVGILKGPEGEKTEVPSIGVVLGTDGKGKVFVQRVTPGGVADKAGVAEGSILVSLQFINDDEKEEEKGKKGTEVVSVHVSVDDQVKRVGRGHLDAQSVALLFQRACETACGEKNSSDTKTVSCELRLRRNLSKDADVNALARKRQRRVVGSDTNISGIDTLADEIGTGEGSRDSFGTSRSYSPGSGLFGDTPDKKNVTPNPNAITTTKPSWPLPRGEQFVVAWEHALLMDLGGAMASFGRDAITKYVGTQAVAHTSLAALAAAVAWPITLLNAGGFIDSPWALVEGKSLLAGRALADALLSGKAGKRPTTLVAYSLGCDVVLRCCEFLLAAEGGEGLGLVQDLVMVGAPLDASRETWDAIRKVTAGRVVNAGDFGDLSLSAASTRGGDWMLRFLFRKKTWAFKVGVAAWTKVEHPGVENVDVGDVCGVHVEIPDRMGDILAKVGLDE